MKKIQLTITLAAALAALCVSCKKEDCMVLSETSTLESNNALFEICLSVDDETFLTTVSNPKEWHNLLDRLFAWAEEGHNVSFWNSRIPCDISAKETVSFSTSSKDEAYAWAEKMGKTGYKVTIVFDSESNQFICIAIK